MVCKTFIHRFDSDRRLQNLKHIQQLNGFIRLALLARSRVCGESLVFLNYFATLAGQIFRVEPMRGKAPHRRPS